MTRVPVIFFVKKSQLQEKNRLDAEYYHPKYIEVYKKIEQLENVILGNVSFITDGQHGYFLTDESSEIRQITAKCIKNNFVDKSNTTRLSKITHEKNLRSSLQEEDVLLSRVGTIGNAAIVTKEIPPANIDQNVARIKIESTRRLNPWYLSIFLNSDFGRMQVERKHTSQVQKFLPLKKVRELKIPTPLWQNEIAEFAKKAYHLHEQSRIIYNKAEKTFLRYLGFQKSDLQYQLWYVKDLSDIVNVNRLDAEYFQPMYDNLIAKIRKKTEVRKLGELVKMKKGIEPGSEAYQEEGIPFVRVCNLTSHGIVSNNLVYLEKELYEKLKLKYQPLVEEILLSKDATPGIAFLIREESEMIISSGIIRLISKTDMNLGYLSLALNSLFIKIQIEKTIGGSVIDHWKPAEIRKTLIPILDEEKRDELGDLVAQSYLKLCEMRQLLENAKQIVERRIISISSS